MTETQTPSGQGQMDWEAEPSMRRRVFIGLALCIVAGVFVVMVGIIWRQSSWQKPTTPSSVLVVEGSKEFEGTKVVIAGSGLRGPLKAEIMESKSFVCRFSLPAGKYTVSIDFPDGLRWQTGIQMDEYQYAWMSRARLEECKKKLLQDLGGMRARGE